MEAEILVKKGKLFAKINTLIEVLDTQVDIDFSKTYKGEILEIKSKVQAGDKVKVNDLFTILNNPTLTPSMVLTVKSKHGKYYEVASPNGTTYKVTRNSIKKLKRDKFQLFRIIN